LWLRHLGDRLLVLLRHRRLASHAGQERGDDQLLDLEVHRPSFGSDPRVAALRLGLEADMPKVTAAG
jgi:hypothetical protein